jgi:phage baseplate assembly protein W
MAIIDINKSKKPFVVDRDTGTFVGLELPLKRSMGAEGNFKCTETTFAAVKTNIHNLLQTELGERAFQPTLGIKLRQFLFEPFTEETETSIKESITKTFNFWLPFVNIIKINVNMVTIDDDVGKNTLKVYVEFSVKNVPNAVDSVQVQFVGG